MPRPERTTLSQSFFCAAALRTLVTFSTKERTLSKLKIYKRTRVEENNHRKNQDCLSLHVSAYARSTLTFEENLENINFSSKIKRQKKASEKSEKIQLKRNQNKSSTGFLSKSQMGLSSRSTVLRIGCCNRSKLCCKQGLKWWKLVKIYFPQIKKKR